MKRLAIIAAPLALCTTPALADDHSRAGLSPEATEALVMYALPHVFDAVRVNCAAVLPSDGYMARNSDRLMAKFEDGAMGTFPAAKAAALAMAGDDNPELTALAELPDEALMPLMNLFLAQKIGEDIKPESCPDIERGLELVDPLPVENIAGLVGFFIEMDQREKAEEQAP